jgi:HK97 gp10 family phage protein
MTPKAIRDRMRNYSRFDPSDRLARGVRNDAPTAARKRFEQHIAQPHLQNNNMLNVNWQRIQDGVAAAVMAAINGTLSEMYELANAKVPVRRIFHGKRKLRFASVEEANEANTIYREKIAKTPFEQFTFGGLVAAPPGFSGSPTSRNGKAFYRVRVDDRALTRRQVSIVNGQRRERTVVNARPASGASMRNALFPTFVRRGRKVTRDFRELANPRALAEGRLKSQFASDKLTSAGRYEVKSRRGQHGNRIGGALKASIRTDAAAFIGTTKIKGSLIAGGKETYYARYVELGTHHAPAQPFLRPALHVARRILRQRMAEAIKRSIKPTEFRQRFPASGGSNAEVVNFMKTMGVL